VVITASDHEKKQWISGTKLGTQKQEKETLMEPTIGLEPMTC